MKSSTSDALNNRILTIRGLRVILDADLARLYGVPTKVFNQAIKRNAVRFPADFAFQLTAIEFEVLRSQIVTTSGRPDEEAAGNWSQFVTSSKASRRGATYRPWAFTEHGAVMAANVLRTPKAVQMSVYIVRAFVAQREALATNQSVLRRLAEIDKALLEHDAGLRVLWRKLQPLLMPPPAPPAKQMGFHTRLKQP